MKSTDFVVVRNDLQHCKFIETELPDAAALPDGTLLVKIDRFAFTANNITYAVLGDQRQHEQRPQQRVEGRGPAAVKQTYLDTLNGSMRADQGHILSLAT